MEPDERDEILTDAELDRIERRVLNADGADPEVRPNTPDRRRVSDNHVLALVRGVRDLKRSRDVHRALLVRALRALQGVGSGPFSRDPHQHAINVIEANREDARAVLSDTLAVALLKEADDANR